MRSREEHWSTRTGKWLLAVVVPLSALAIGSLLTPWLLVTSALAAVSCALLWVRPPERTSGSSRWLALAIVVCTTFTLLQCIPIPAGLAAAIAPGTADAWARSLAPLQESGPAFHPLSVAPVASHIEVLRGLTYGCVFLGALRVASSDGGSTFLERVVIVATAVVAVSTLLHPAFHAGRVFGIYAPRDLYGYYPGRIGPLLNANHVSAYMNVGACLALGAAMDGRVLPRPIAVAAAVLLAGTSVWAGSRGGMGGIVVAVVIVLGLTVLRRRDFALARGELVLTVLAVVCGVLMTALALSDTARGEAADTDTSKVGIALKGLGLVPLAPLTGVGRGAFETMYPLFRVGPFYATQTHPENVAVQWLAEWGVPCTVVVALLVFAALRPKVVLLAARPAIGAWAAVVVTVVHDLVDFHLEVPGVVVAICVCAASVVGARAFASERGPRRAWPAIFRGLAATTAVAVIPCALLVWSERGHTLAEERAEIARMTLDRNVDPNDFRAALRGALLRYPSEPYFPLAGAIRAQAAGDATFVAWAARALERYPLFGRAHLVLARGLARRNPSQARLEYRLAYAQDSGLREAIEKEALPLVQDYESALELVPEGGPGDDVLEILASALGDRLPATAARLDAELVRRNPRAMGPARRLARGALSDLIDELGCARRECADRALAAAEVLVNRQPELCEPRVALARVRLASGERERAFDELRTAAESSSERPKCLRAFVDLAVEHQHRARAQQGVQLAVQTGCGGGADCLELYSWAGGVEDTLGAHAKAAGHYKMAHGLAPDRDYLLERRASAALRANLTADALDAYEMLARRHPEDPQWNREVERLKGRIRGQLAVPP